MVHAMPDDTGDVERDDAGGTGDEGPASKSTSRHAVTARTKARRRAVEILFEGDQRGLLRATGGDDGGDGEADDASRDREHGDEHGHDREHVWDGAPGSGGAAERLREFASERAVHSANHTEAPAYTREILSGVADHLAEVDEIIETYSQGWTLARMPAVDRAIARIATWEIVWNDDVDAPIAVDEAMTLSRMLSTDDSPRFLNGLLGRIGDLADTLR